MNHTLTLVENIKIISFNKINLGLKNRENIKNSIINYDFSFIGDSRSSNLNDEIFDNINHLMLEIIKVLFKIVKIYKSDLIIPFHLYKNFYKGEQLLLIKEMNEWLMDTQTLKKVYTEVCLQWRLYNNFKDQKYKYTFLCIVYERVILNDDDALQFCFWLYYQNNDDLYIK